MLKSFRHKGLDELWSTGRSGKVDAKMYKRIFARLDALEVATEPEGMNIPGFNFHALKGHDPKRYTVHVNGPWCVTFEFDGTDAVNIDLEQYH